MCFQYYICLLKFQENYANEYIGAYIINDKNLYII